MNSNLFLVVAIGIPWHSIGESSLKGRGSSKAVSSLIRVFVRSLRNGVSMQFRVYGWRRLLLGNVYVGFAAVGLLLVGCYWFAAVGLLLARCWLTAVA